MSENFQYVAIDSRGQKTQGSLEALNRAQAAQQLKAKRLRVVSLKSSATVKSKKKGAVAKDTPTSRKKKFVAKDVVVFTEELSELLESGLPLEPALASMQGRSESGVLQQVSAELRRYITEGEHMYQALPKVSPAFDALYCNLVKAGEAGGGLQMILSHHSRYLGEQMELKSKLRLALIYPCSLFLLCIVFVFLFIFFMVPTLVGLVESMPGAETPVSIAIGLTIREFLTQYWVYLLIGLGILISGVKVWMDRESSKAKWDRVVLDLPVLGKVVLYSIYVQWLQTLGNLLNNGVPLEQALKLTQETIENRHVLGRLRGIHEGVSDGYRFTACMSKSEVFPANMVDLVAVGETTGDLTKAVERSAKYYEKRLNSLIQTSLALLTPIVLVFIALLILAFALTFVQALYGAMQNMG